MVKCWKVVPHTADYAFRVAGKTREELYKNGVIALQESIYGSNPLIENKIDSYNLHIESIDSDSLFIDWLREIYNFLEIEKKYIFRAKIAKLSDCALSAQLELVQLKDHSNKITEIKAITYHNSKIIHENNRYFVQVVCDL